MRRRPGNPWAGAFANPLLVGAITVLVTVVAVFLSYNANQGLPFVPTYDFKVLLPDSSNLVRGNEVRIGGKRVGLVSTVEAKQERDGETVAVLSVKIAKTEEPLPVDTAATIRPRSTLGLKYLDLTPGRSKKNLKPNAELALRNARDVVDLDEVVDTFDAATRRAGAQAVTELGNGLAGRGQDFNQLLVAAPPLLKGGTHLARTLAAPETDLAGLVPAVARVTDDLATVTPQLGRLVADADTTAGALASRRAELGDILSEAPATEAEATRTLRVARPVLRGARVLIHDLRPAAPLLRPSALRLHRAIRTGLPVLKHVLPLAGRLKTTLVSVRELSADPLSRRTLDHLLAALESATPTVDYLVPAQTVCNYLGAWTHNVPSTISEGDSAGTWFRTLVVVPLDGENVKSGVISANTHSTPYPHSGQAATGTECEAGNEPYKPGSFIGNPAGSQRGATIDTAPPPGTPRP